jgi:hypothetical protein
MDVRDKTKLQGKISGVLRLRSKKEVKGRAATVKEYKFSRA